VLYIVLSCFLVIIHFTAELYLSANSLTGSIPTEIALMSNLSEFSVVWLLVVMIVLSCVIHCTLMLACHIHSTVQLFLFNNNFTGEFTCPDFIDDYNCWISCDVETDTYTQACRSL
jgi:hypothetical protein